MAPQTGAFESTVILTVPALPAFSDVAQTAIEELARRAGVDEGDVSRLSLAVADTVMLLTERGGAESIRLWFEADVDSVAVEAGPVLGTADAPVAPLLASAVRRFQEGLADLVDLVAIDTGTSVVRFVKLPVAVGLLDDAKEGDFGGHG